MNVDELLAQATCAIRAGSDQDSGEVIGTAWLATDQGHLITAGHIVKGLYDAGRVWVRFPDADHDEAASFILPPVHDKAMALDFAVLKLESPTTRRPLPFTLVSRAEGQVRARGYGSNLPNAQSPGHGVLLGNYLRTASSKLYLFQYLSSTLSIPGFSGAAVHSDVSNAVIGLQIEQEGGRSALAMPMARIADHWADLVAAATQPPRGMCVLLLPTVASAETRRRLQDEILRPVLDSLNLGLYVSELGRTNREDLRQLEQADVVIADVTYDDANVTYELTVAQGIGTPDVALVQKGVRERTGQLPFQVVEIDVNDVPEARRTVERRLVSVRSIFEALGEPDSVNPMTDFFKAPLTQISAANALALGYEINFVRPVGRSLLELAAGVGAGRVTVDGRQLTPDQLREVTLTVVLPERLEWADDGFIHRRLAKPGLVVDALVEHPSLSRPRSLKCLPIRDSEPVRLVDPFPTTLATLSEAIDERLGLEPDQRVLPVWHDLERKEIDRFYSRLVQRIRRDSTEVAGRRLREVCLVSAAAPLWPELG